MDLSEAFEREKEKEKNSLEFLDGTKLKEFVGGSNIIDAPFEAEHC